MAATTASLPPARQVFCDWAKLSIFGAPGLDGGPLAVTVVVLKTVVTLGLVVVAPVLDGCSVAASRSLRPDWSWLGAAVDPSASDGSS